MGLEFKEVKKYADFGTDLPQQTPAEVVISAYFYAGLIQSRGLSKDERAQFLNRIGYFPFNDEKIFELFGEDLNFHEKTKADVEKNQKLLLQIYNDFAATIKNSPQTTVDNFYPSLPHIAEIFQLTERQKYILALVAFLQTNEPFNSLIDYLCNDDITTEDTRRFAGYILSSIRDDKKTISDDFETLLKHGLIFKAQNEDVYILNSPIYSLFQTKISTRDETISFLLGKPAKAQYPIEDWAHIPDFLELKEALKENPDPNAKNIGIIALINGMPGVGKTEAIRSLGEATGRPVFTVANDSDDAEEPKPKPSELIARLRVLLKLIPYLPEGAIVFADDGEVLMAHDSASGDKTEDPAAKHFFNELFDEANRRGLNLIIALNDEGKFPASVISRSLQYYFGSPPINQREKIFSRQMEEKRLSFTPDQVKSLAKKYIVPSRMIDRSMALCSRIKGDYEKFCEILERKAEREFGSRDAILAPLAKNRIYEWGLVNARDADLQKAFNGMAHQNFEGQQNPFFTKSLLLAGPSGTGKESFAHHLACELDTEIEIIDGRSVILSSRSSGGISPGLQLTYAFRNAVEYNRVLLINNIDDLVPTQNDPDSQAPSYAETISDLMEQYKVRVVFTTKSSEAALDEKFFTYVPNVIQLDPLTETQTRKALETIYGFKAEDISKLGDKIPDNLVASDFHVALMNNEDTSLEGFITALDRAAHLRQRGLTPPKGETGFRRQP